jgi:hypothetical protein
MRLWNHCRQYLFRLIFLNVDTIPAIKIAGLLESEEDR